MNYLQMYNEHKELTLPTDKTKKTCIATPAHVFEHASE